MEEYDEEEEKGPGDEDARYNKGLDWSEWSVEVVKDETCVFG